MPRSTKRRTSPRRVKKTSPRRKVTSPRRVKKTSPRRVKKASKGRMDAPTGIGILDKIYWNIVGDPCNVKNPYPPTSCQNAFVGEDFDEDPEEVM